MNSRTGWFLTLGGAAAAVAVTGFALRRKASGDRSELEDAGGARSFDSEIPQANRGEFQSGMWRARTSELDSAHDDAPDSVAEALRASEHAHGLRHAMSEEFEQTLTDRAEARSDERAQRLDAAWLLAPHGLVESPSALERDLKDSDAVELPVGDSADAELQALLEHDGEPATSRSTGSSKWDGAVRAWGEHEEPNRRAETSEPTVQITQRFVGDDAEASVVTADDLGTDFLQRATQASGASRLESEDAIEEAELIDIFGDADSTMVSEASTSASDPAELERAVLARLARMRGDLLPEDQETAEDADDEQLSRR